MLASEESDEVIALPDDVPYGDYAVAFDPLDGSSNTDNSMPMGTIFSIYKRITPAFNNLLFAFVSVVCGPL